MEWQPMESAPKDGRLVLLKCADPHDFSTEDSGDWVTIGFNPKDLDNGIGDEWLAAGWHWSQDCFTHAEGVKPLAWCPIPGVEAPR